MNDFEKIGISLSDYDPKESINLAEAAKLIPSVSGHVAVEVVRRWIRKGASVRRGSTERLHFPAVWGCGEYRTMRVWVEAFIAARTQLSQPPKKEEGPTDRQRQASQRRAAKVLEDAGIG